MLLSTFIFFDLDLELFDLVLMFLLPPAQLLNIVQIHFLSLHAAHLFPLAEPFIGQLLVDRSPTSGQELFGEFVSPYEETPRLVAIVDGFGVSSVYEVLSF